MKKEKYRIFESTLINGEKRTWKYNYKITLKLASTYAYHFCNVKKEEISNTIGIK